MGRVVGAVHTGVLQIRRKRLWIFFVAVIPFAGDAGTSGTVGLSRDAGLRSRFFLFCFFVCFGSRSTAVQSTRARQSVTRRSETTLLTVAGELSPN